MNTIELHTSFIERVKREGITATVVRAFRDLVYGYYTLHGRKLPWRETRDPYHILVSEIMLQQTQVGRVLDKFPPFIRVFPDFTTLSKAPLHNIMQLWQGLGYNRRAHALKQIAERVISIHSGCLPTTVRELAALPGIGIATASSIATFAFNKPVIFLETNIRTVFIHTFFPDKSAVDDIEILPLAKKTLDRKNPRRWYNALMDYGAILKREKGNAGRKSTRYRKQSPFEGSNRRLRGAILKALIETPRISEAVLIQKVAQPGKRVRECCEQLQREGLVKKQGSLFVIG